VTGSPPRSAKTARKDENLCVSCCRPYSRMPPPHASVSSVLTAGLDGILVPRPLIVAAWEREVLLATLAGVVLHDGQPDGAVYSNAEARKVLFWRLQVLQLWMGSGPVAFFIWTSHAPIEGAVLRVAACSGSSANLQLPSEERGPHGY
jgi:hypothetical protein